MNKKKRGLSPVIATVLLIAIVIAIALIIFLWVRGMTEESVTKFSGENIKLSCDKVSYNAQYENGNLYFSNDGNVPIYRIEIDSIIGGTHESKNIEDLVTNWPSNGLGQGKTFSGNLASHLSGAESFKIIPVLIGNSDDGKKTYICSESKGVREFEI
ncbi:type IV pilin [archaeon]|jgi:flagellin-like protein|nr:type IV pilin [archaeon]